MKKFQIKAKILKNARVQGQFFKIQLEALGIAKEAKTGQFINIKVSDNGGPLLRRPFSIHSISGNTVTILYAMVGKGTQILSQRKAGEYLDIIGPLGSGFRVPLACARGRQGSGFSVQILVAGGMGVAPLLFLAEKLTEIKNQKSTLRLRSGLMVSAVEPSKIKKIVLIGAKTQSQILCAGEFQELGCEVEIATDDGSRGFKGKVTELLKSILRRTKDQGRRTIYACGPRPMLQEISRLSQEYKIPAQVSLDEHLACGIGACLGCAIKTRQGYERVCKEGPVFNAEEIIW